MSGKELIKLYSELNSQSVHLTNTIKNMLIVNKYQIANDYTETINHLLSDAKDLEASLKTINNQLKEFQQTCKHINKSYTGHCYKWDHYKCDNCNKNFEE